MQDEGPLIIERHFKFLLNLSEIELLMKKKQLNTRRKEVKHNTVRALFCIVKYFFRPVIQLTFPCYLKFENI